MTLSDLIKLHGKHGEAAVAVPPVQIAQQMVEWTDPERAIVREGVEPDESGHLVFAQSIVDRIYVLNPTKRKDERKILTSLLSKLSLPAEIDTLQLRTLLRRIAHCQTPDHALADAASRNALVRFAGSLQKRYKDQLAILDDDERQQVHDDHDEQEELAELVRKAQLESDGSESEAEAVPAKRRRKPSKPVGCVGDVRRADLTRQAQAAEVRGGGRDHV